MQRLLQFSRLLLTKKDFVKDLLAALSLACLFFIRIWGALLNPRHSQFFAETILNRFDYLAILFNTAFFFSVFLAACRLTRWSNSSFAYRAFCLALFMGLLPFVDYLRRTFSFTTDHLIGVQRVLLFIPVLLGFYIIYRYFKTINRIIYAGLIILSPFSVVVVSSAIYFGFTGAVPDGPDNSKPFTSAPPAPAPNRRIVWVIFDELDQSVLFERRPAGLQLPNLDLFAHESIVAENAYPPAGNTILSIPSLLMSRFVDDATLGSDNQLRIHFKGDPTVSIFGRSPSIITDIGSQGKRVAIVGWYFPYGRIFPETSTRWVRWGALPQTQGFSGQSFTSAVFAQWLFILYPMSVRSQVGELYSSIHRYSLAAVASPAADLVFLHYPTPHPPGIFDPKSGRLSGAYTSSVAGYLNNLQLVDHAVAEILSALRNAGLDTRTTMIISSDHWWRGSPMLDGKLDHRIPFMIRLPSAQGQRFTPIINTVVSAELISALVNGSLENQDAIIRFLADKAVATAFQYTIAGQIFNN